MAQILIALVVAATILEGSNAVVFRVTNNATNTTGGERFTQEIGIPYTKQALGGPGARPLVKPGEGDQWDQGYDVTAWFLNYLNDLQDGFVAKLNKKMRYGYSDAFFAADLLGKSVNELWKEYKAYSNHSSIIHN